MVFIVGGQVWAAHSDSSTRSSHASTEWDDMKAKRPSFGISRRVALTTAAVLPILFGFMLPISQAQAQTDPLPSWNDGASKRAIVEFVAKVSRQGGPNFVPPAERIATFDNDGTLWAEQPLYFQFLFAIDRVKALAPQHPEWKCTTQEICFRMKKGIRIGGI